MYSLKCGTQLSYQCITFIMCVLISSLYSSEIIGVHNSLRHCCTSLVTDYEQFSVYSIAFLHIYIQELYSKNNNKLLPIKTRPFCLTISIRCHYFTMNYTKNSHRNLPKPYYITFSFTHTQIQYSLKLQTYRGYLPMKLNNMFIFWNKY